MILWKSPKWALIDVFSVVEEFPRCDGMWAKIRYSHLSHSYKIAKYKIR